MRTDTEGLILMDRVVGDKDRCLVILTKDCGVKNCFVRRANKPNSRNFSATQPLSYSRFSIFEGRQYCVVEEAVLIRTFFGSAEDLVRLSLANYFCELVMKTVPENTESSQVLELLLNSLHLLEKNSQPERIKTIFEIRLAVISGWMPQLLYCSGCGAYEDETMYFYYQENTLRCIKCHSEGLCCPLSKGALTAFRYVLCAEPKKIFSFRTAEDSLRQLGVCTEKYITAMTAAHLYTLDYYHQVVQLEKDTAGTETAE